LLPGAIEGAAPPALPAWVKLERSERLELARAAIIAHKASAGRDMVLRVAMPDGPGGRLLFAQIASDWEQIGVKALRAGPKGEADIRLVDTVAPHGSVFWYFGRASCARGIQCSPQADQLVRLAWQAKDPVVRAEAIARADLALAEAQTFIPLAAPLRWSLVAPRLQGYRESPFAIHPLGVSRYFFTACTKLAASQPSTTR
jgi:oligopeptide transport system substrate-binding protein